MERGEFEKNIQEKLGQRTITPSTKAWKKLEATLDAVPEKRSNFKYWYWVAASIFVLVAVGSMFYNTSTTDNAPIEIVNTKKGVEEQQELDPLSTQDNSETEVVSAIDRKKEPAFERVEKPNKKPKKDLPTIADVQEQATLITALHSLEPIPSDKEHEETVEVHTLIKDTTSTSEVTITEIDLLLTQAQQQLASEKPEMANSSKVDATALLQDVEAELNKPFKEKIFEMLKEGYEKGKILVAERN